MDFEDNDALGLESNTRMSYSKFQTTFLTRRQSQAPGRISEWLKVQLPAGSVLHTLNGLGTLVPPEEGLPDISMPLLHNEKNPIYLKLATALSSDKSHPFGVDENYTYRPNKMSALISHFFQRHRLFHRVLSDRTLSTMAGVLTWVDYSPLNEAKVNGTLGSYRKFDILFRTILNTVCQIGNGKHHFIVIPQEHHVYPRATLMRTFKELSTSTLNGFKHDPSIYPIIHVLGWLYGKTHELHVTPYKEDILIHGKDNKSLLDAASTSYFEHIPEDMYESINFIFQRGDKCVIYNMKDLNHFREDASFFQKFYRHMMNLRLKEGMVPNHVDVDSDQFDTFVGNVSGTPLQTISVQSEIPVVITNESDPGIPRKENSEVIKTDILEPVHNHDDLKISEAIVHSSFEDKVRKASVIYTAPHLEVEPKKESKHTELLERHFKVSLAGKPLSERIGKALPTNILPRNMDFIESIPEESYKKSTLMTMDSTYMEHGYHHELAKVVSSVAQHGFYISKIDEDHQNTEMDRLTHYKIAMNDIDGKAHSIRFTLPHVDDAGLMKLGGIEYRLTRQIANVPICKISPIRVNLSSYYNKVIIERIQSKRFSFENDMMKLISRLRKEGLLEAIAGTAPLSTVNVPYDYTALGKNFTQIGFNGFDFHFHGDHAPYPILFQKEIESYKGKFGVYVGSDKANNFIFWDLSNQIHLVSKGQILQSWPSFISLLVDQLGSEALPDKTTLEWTQAHILNQTIPLVYILGYAFGLQKVLDKIKLKYKFYPKGQRAETDLNDIAIKFNDGVLVFNRYPLTKSLIVTGLTWASLKDISFLDMNVPQTYVRILQSKGMNGVGVLKGLRGFLDFFVDPITETILRKMHEPVTFPDLLLRANVMLSDYHAIESSSVKLHRFRLYERFNGIVYNEIYRALANHRNNPSSKKAFSINPEAVFQSIVQDATVSPNDTINPVHEGKQRANFTFTGAGGRSGNSFVQKDRIYPKDGVGVISEAVPDSGKVGITAYLSASPNIDDIHGLPTSHNGTESLEPPQILSIANMIMPGATTDDGKRASYSSIQISHYVPNHVAGETMSVRTGYDAVLPHLSSDLFASAAEDDGVIESIDPKQRVIKIRYQDTDIETLSSLKVPYLDTIIDRYRHTNENFGILVTDEDIGNYPIGGIFSLTRTTNGKIIDRLRCETVDAIPDKEIARKQNSLIKDFMRGKYKALYYIRFSAIGKHTPGLVKSYSYSDVYSPISGSYLLQKREVNVTVGEKIKRGDILTYNSGFFVPDPLSKQVTFKHGVTATVALVEKGSNHEDACEISQDLSKRLMMTPCHQREIVMKNTAVILQTVKVGDHVEVSDSLCIISDDYLVQSAQGPSSDNLDLMEKLNRQTPSSNYTGTVAKVRVLYGCERERLSDSLKLLLKTYEREVRQEFASLNNDPTLKAPDRPGFVKTGTHYLGTIFTEETVVIEYMIQEELDVQAGDKLVLSSAAKSVVSHVTEKPHYTESGIPVDMLFSTTSILNRIIGSPWLGLCEMNLLELKKQAIKMYFG